MNGDSKSEGFQKGGTNEDLFRGTASFYEKYRRPYPAPVVNFLEKQFTLNGKGRLLDAGCGTGQVFQVMAHLFTEVVAIDSNEEMVRLATRAAEQIGQGRVRVLEMHAEEIDERLGNFHMAVFGASFHWMDRKQVGDLVYDRLEPGGYIVILSPQDIQSGVTKWEAEVRAILKEWLGPERRAGQGVYQAGERHAEALRKTRFRHASEMDINVLEQWSIDQIVGYLFSTSYASRSVLGEKAEDFERTIRERLLALRTDGCFEKLNEYTAIWATRSR